MSDSKSMDRLLDLLIDALEERKTARDNGADEIALVDTQSAKDTNEATNTVSARIPTFPIPFPFPPSESKTKLPTSWKPWAMQHYVESAETVTPELIEAICNANPKVLRALNQKIVRAMPLAALVALPSDRIWDMPYRQRLYVQERLAEAGHVRVPAVGEAVVTEEASVEVEDDSSELDGILVSAEIAADAPPPILDVPAEPAIVISDNLPRTLVRLLIGLFAIVVIANFKIVDISTLNASLASNNQGDTRIAFARDGMLLRGSGQKVYIIEDNQRRWITTSEAFTSAGYRWNMVRVVEDDYLAQFERGDNIDLVVKCPQSRHIFLYTATEEGGTRTRRYIADIETFTSLGFEWQDIRTDLCQNLASTSDGAPIPETHDGRVPGPYER